MPRLLRRDGSCLLTALVLLGSLLLLSCQPAQPVATPKPGEKAAATAKPAETAAEKPVRGGTFRLYLGGDPLSLDPNAVTVQNPDFSMFDTLIGPDQGMNVTKEGPARDWSIGGDGKSITIKLREGIKFHDGTNFDAAAVKFNIERMKDPATKSPYASNYAGVESVEVLDSLTARFNLKQPDPLLLPRMMTMGGMMVSPTAVQKLGQDFGRKPVGTGPFQFVEWVSGDHITAKRFEGYWGKDKAGNQLPYLDQVVWKIITDPTTAFANLRTGQIELMGTSSGVPSEQIGTLKGDANLAYSIQVNANLSHLRLNTKRAPFNNKALRQAVALALDREGTAAFFGEGAKPWASVFHPNNWGVDPQIGVFPARDLVKARAKMAEAGYPSGGLKVKILAGTTASTMKPAEILKANLAEIGIDSEIESLASAALLTKRDLEQDFHLAPGSSGQQLTDPGHIFGLGYHSKGTRNYYGPYGSPKVDELIDKAGSIYDEKERMALYREAAKILVDEVPFISTHVNNTFAGLSKKVRNWAHYADINDRVREVWLAQ